MRERNQWAIEQVMAHKAPVDTTSYATDGNTEGQVKGKQSKKRNTTDEGEKPAVQVQTLNFQVETDKAQIKVTVTDMGNSFILDVTSDQVIQGWLLKRQSTREVFLKGGASPDNPYRCRIRADRPYVRDFGLTVYVTQDSVPAFVQLF